MQIAVVSYREENCSKEASGDENDAEHSERFHSARTNSCWMTSPPTECAHGLSVQVSLHSLFLYLTGEGREIHAFFKATLA